MLPCGTSLFGTEGDEDEDEDEDDADDAVEGVFVTVLRLACDIYVAFLLDKPTAPMKLTITGDASDRDKIIARNFKGGWSQTLLELPMD